MTLKTDIANWDAKDVSVIQSVYDQYSESESFADQLINMLMDEPVQRGATWLIKLFLENKNVMTEGQVALLLDALPVMNHWEAQLHILQCLPYVKIPEKNVGAVHRNIMDITTSDAKFVRAWAYGGLIEVSEQYREYREKSRKIIQKAYSSEAGSICARIRQASKKRPYWQEILS